MDGEPVHKLLPEDDSELYADSAFKYNRSKGTS